MTQKLQFLSTVYPKGGQTCIKIISEPLSQLVNETIVNEGFFPHTEKIVCITPAFKKEDRLDYTNYRPISVLNVFSKVFKRFILDQLTSYFKSILSEFRSAYRKQCSCQHVLLRMIETWCKCLDENKIVGATLTDLSKAFNCLPHDLLVAKLEAYDLDTKTLKLMLSYLSGRKQCVKVKNSFSLLKLILFDIPHGSILEPIFFNIFMNDIFFLLGSHLHNSADDNTVTAVANRNKFKAIVLTKTDHYTAGIRPNSYVVLLPCRTK